ncbi:hypothetical protein SNE35_29365 [Paucibacter sp. R3-3]|uniref:Uncharacterized protein n=1 Tax=Roseateles agri TaxID=3098619 RepID=A0ABU5DQP1_9BURK|nr:hypothetical protein [Paucibacter sp. R3-3]MDY0748643.1 hypothetical protein [Paucibacter sp. R3-3]
MFNSVSREGKDFEYHLNRTMVRLNEAFKIIFPSMPIETLNYIYWRVLMDENAAQSLERSFGVSGQNLRQYPIVMGCICCARAKRALDHSRSRFAWNSLARASYFAGSAILERSLEIFMPEFKHDAEQKALSEMRSKGGKQRVAPWKTVEDELVRLVILEGEKGKCWTTERQIVRHFRMAIIGIAEKSKLKISEATMVDTFSRRLKQRGTDIGKYLRKKGAGE